MISSLVLVHSSKEFRQILARYPELRDSSEVCFLTANVDAADMIDFPSARVFYCDSRLTIDDLHEIHHETSQILETWYIDKSGQDLTNINGLSVGRCYCLFMYHLLSFALKMKRLINTAERNYQTIFITETKNKFLTAFLKDELKSQSKLKILPIFSTETEFIPTPTIHFKTTSNSIYFNFRWQLKNILRMPYVLFIQYLHYFFKSKKHVIMTDSGKIDDVIAFYSQAKNDPVNFDFIFPLQLKSFSIFSKKNFFFINPFHYFYKNTARRMASNLALHGQESPFLARTLVSFLVNTYLAPTFAGVIAYYSSARSQLRRLRADLFIASAESHETNLAIAQAAKSLGIKTATIPHGIAYPLLPTSFYKESTMKIYDSAFIFSSASAPKWIERGFSPRELYVSSFYHFFKMKFLPKREPIVQYKKALILPFDFNDLSRMNFVLQGVRDIVDLCLELKITNLGIKTRIENQLKTMFVKNGQVQYRGLTIPTFFGYYAFPQIVVQYDFVIGPLASSLIESLAMGIDYYSYNPVEVNIGTWEYSPFFDIIYVAQTQKELADNIKNRKIFRPGKSLDDIILLSSISDKTSFFKFFENSVSDCLERTHDEKNI